MSTKKKIFTGVVLLALIAGGYKLYDVYVNYRFMAISEGKVYKSGVIPPDEIAGFVAKYKIKTIIDLRGPVTTDTINNPEMPADILAEKQAAAKIPNLNWVNIPSNQVPNSSTLARFFEVMDNAANYPVLIHCHHGIGRAQLYSALYRIEYEGWSPDDARRKAAFPLLFSSFDDGTEKGEYLKAYQPRRLQK
jgi:protein tyrosine/serine phosphatase